MKRALVFAALVLAWSVGMPLADAQSLAPVPRIGVLGFSAVSGGDPSMESFRRGLRELGYVEGKNIAVEWRWAEGRSDRAAELAAELVHLRVSVLVTSGTPAAEAARHATRKIPIVLASVADAVGSGLVRSLARPGGNITGVSLNCSETAGKHLELLRQILPGIARVAFLGSTTDPTARLFVEGMERAGQRLGIRIQVLMVGGTEELEGAFTAMEREQAGALVIPPVFAEPIHKIVELAARNRLPTVSSRRDFAEAGVLITYGADRRESWRRAAIYVHKILKGAKAADLPVSEPTTHELMVNLKTARALGLAVPPSVLARANGMIQ